MTEPKNQRMSIIEKFYIENNWETLDLDTLSNHTKIQKRSVKQYVEKLKKKKDQSQAANKVEQSQATSPIVPAQDMIARKGVAIMTKSAAEIVDEIRKRVKKVNSNCIVKIRENDV
jgi:hypothetical protein